MYDLDPHELRLLHELCRQVDLGEALQAAIDADGVVIPTVGGTGPKVNPVVVEIRQCRIAIARLAAALRIPAADDNERAGRGIRGVYTI